MKYLVIVEQLKSANQGSPYGFISVSALPPEDPIDAGGTVQTFLSFYFSLCQVHQWGIL